MPKAADAQKGASRIRLRSDMFVSKLEGELVPPTSGRAGFQWWSPSEDWRRDALISDYLMQSVEGTASAVCAARYSALRHEEAVYSQVADVKLLMARRPTRDQFLSFMNTPQASTRALESETAIEATYYHCWQTLDRVAAVLAVVGAFPIGVQRVDFGKLEKVRNQLRNPTQADPKELAANGTDLRPLQEVLLDSLTPAHGPDGWLAWLRNARNGATHRAPTLNMHYLQKNGELVALLNLNPNWSDLESLAYAGRDLRNGAPGAYLSSDPRNVISGLVDSIEQFVVDLLDVADQVWEKRKALGITEQPAKQWADVGMPQESDFAGYGREVDWRQIDFMYANPKTGRRFESARVMDNQVAEWQPEPGA